MLNLGTKMPHLHHFGHNKNFPGKKTGSVIFMRLFITELPTQPAVTCSKLIIATLEQGVKYVLS